MFSLPRRLSTWTHSAICLEKNILHLLLTVVLSKEFKVEKFDAESLDEKHDLCQ